MDENHSKLAERRLDRAVQHVMRSWFPINQGVLNQIRKDLDAGTYKTQPNKLFTDLKADFALFTYVVKELTNTATQAGVGLKIIANPVELIKWAGPDIIKAAIAPEKSLPTTHSLASSEPFQIARLRETAVIVSTAVVLSELKNLDPELGFSRGVMREIGLNLIAWNYPTLFSKIVGSLTADTSLDEELSRELGFTPTLLALKVINPSRMPAGPEAPKERDVPPTDWALYDELCAIGEALARAEHPETYPSADHDWQRAVKYLNENGGTGALDRIKDRAVEQAKRYQDSIPDSFPSFDSLWRRGDELKAQTNSIEMDADFQRCPLPLQTSLRSLYAEMKANPINKTIIHTLLNSVIPQAGFTGGCVFVVDPTSASLKRRNVIGNVKLRAIDKATLDLGDMAVTALSLDEPLVANKTIAGSYSSATQLSGMYGTLSTARRVGVLYLEAPIGNDSAQRDNALCAFKTLKRALSDALHLN